MALFANLLKADGSSKNVSLKEPNKSVEKSKGREVSSNAVVIPPFQTALKSRTKPQGPTSVWG
jgi:hypothetical protein